MSDELPDWNRFSRERQLADEAGALVQRLSEERYTAFERRDYDRASRCTLARVAAQARWYRRIATWKALMKGGK